MVTAGGFIKLMSIAEHGKSQDTHKCTGT